MYNNISTNRTYYHSVDFLRGVTALLIAIYHFINFTEGDSQLFAPDNPLRTLSSSLPDTVLIFFLLSGFVISMTMRKKNYSIQKIGNFLGRRLLRIQIPYLASILVYLGIALVWSIKSNSSFEFDIMRFMHHVIYTARFFNYEWYNDIYWTLAIEFQFYILIALLFPFFTSQNSLIKYASLIVFSAMGLIYNQHDLIFKYGSIFSIGILISSYISSEKKNATDIALISLFLIEIWYLFNFIAVVYLVAGIVILGISINKNNVFCKLGIQAYSFYLLHGAIGGSTLYFISPYASNLFLKIIAVAISVILSISISHIFYKYIEVPSLSLSRKVKS